MALFIVSLAVVFLTAILAYVISRLGYQGTWPPPEAPGLPLLLVVSTAIIVVSSGSMMRAMAAVQRDWLLGLQRWMLVTLVLGVSFLVVQAFAWWELIRAYLLIDGSLYAWSFYVLTGMHAAHLVGGLIPMVVVLVRAYKRRYSSENYQGVAYLSTYWHFLDIAWIALYATLMWGEAA